MSVYKFLTLGIVMVQQAPTWEVGVHIAEAQVAFCPELGKLTQAGACVEVIPQHCCIIAWQGIITPCQHLVFHIILLLPHLHLCQCTSLLRLVLYLMRLIKAASSFALPASFGFFSGHPSAAWLCRQGA